MQDITSHTTLPVAQFQRNYVRSGNLRPGHSFRFGPSSRQEILPTKKNDPMMNALLLNVGPTLGKTNFLRLQDSNGNKGYTPDRLLSLKSMPTAAAVWQDTAAQRMARAPFHFADDVTDAVRDNVTGHGTATINHRPVPADHHHQSPAASTAVVSPLSPVITDEDSFSEYSLGTGSVGENESPTTTPPASPFPDEPVFDDETTSEFRVDGYSALFDNDDNAPPTPRRIEGVRPTRMPELPHLKPQGRRRLEDVTKNKSTTPAKRTKAASPVASRSANPLKYRRPVPVISSVGTKRKRELELGSNLANKKQELPVINKEPGEIKKIEWENELVRAEQLYYEGKHGQQQIRMLLPTLIDMGRHTNIPVAWIKKRIHLRNEAGQDMSKNMFELVEYLLDNYADVQGPSTEEFVRRSNKILKAWAPA
ncbi:hypothetical protein C8F01DRAFT_1116554 [Mycena amicta]|nr:hypothetical protein C8F01DRAFT_1116554 [Mycena amicta]